MKIPPTDSRVETRWLTDGNVEPYMRSLLLIVQITRNEDEAERLESL
jgi:hypothetical protein